MIAGVFFFVEKNPYTTSSPVKNALKGVGVSVEIYNLHRDASMNMN